MSLASNDYGGKSERYATAVGSGIAHSGGRFTTDEYGSGTFDDGIRWSYADGVIADDSGGHITDKHGGCPGADDRAADMRDGWYAGCLHGAGMEIRKTSCRGHK